MKRILIYVLLLISIVFILSCQSTARETEAIKEHIVQEQPQLQVDKPAVYLTTQNSALAQGYVRNSGNVTAYSVTADVTFYDKEGTILDTQDDYIDKLEVGDQWKWEVKYRGPATVGLPEAKVSVTYYATDQEIDQPIITYN
jgi:hypothetical protein